MKIQHSKIEQLAEYALHLKNLSNQDRYTRFGYHAGPQNIDQLILQILYNPEQHHIFTYRVDDRVVGFGHLAGGHTDWELAVSVESDYQGRGIADELMSNMITWGKTHGVSVVYMHCIVDNQKIQHLASKHGLRPQVRSAQDLTSRVELPRATVLDYTSSLVQEQNDLATDIVKLQRSWLKKWFHPLS